MSSPGRTRYGSIDKSPVALLRRRQRTFLWGTVVGLAVAVVIGLLLPVGDMTADRTENTTRGARR